MNAMAGNYTTADGRKIGGVMMEMKNITLRFGGVVAIKDISFDIHEGEIRAIIGPNGAGKSSMLNVISGFYNPQEGEAIYSVDIAYTSTKDPITFYPSSVTTRINLSETTYFEITDRNGKLLRSGTSSTIQLQDLKPGEYYLHIQNRIERFVKK